LINFTLALPPPPAITSRQRRYCPLCNHLSNRVPHCCSLQLTARTPQQLAPLEPQADPSPRSTATATCCLPPTNLPACFLLLPSTFVPTLYTPRMASSNRNRRIAKEIADIQNDQHSKIVVEPAGNGDDLTHLRGQFFGPPDTPYEGGSFTVDIKIPSEYPFRPPVMRFETKLWHPNVSSQTVSDSDKLHLPTANSSGCYLSRYALFPVVAGLDHQICAYLSPIPPQHARTQGSPRCRSRWYAH
jgi:hypothetical protein